MAKKKFSPFSVGVKDLLHQAGEMRELTLDIVAPEHYGEAMAVVAEGAPLHIELRLEGLHEGILVTGEVHTVAQAQCVRCLDDVQLTHQVDFQELFAYSGDEADSYTVDHDALELEGIIRDAIVLDLPFQPVCEEECFGLNPDTGEKREAPAGEPSGTEIDPRWQELTKLLKPESPEAP